MHNKQLSNKSVIPEVTYCNLQVGCELHGCGLDKVNCAIE